MQALRKVAAGPGLSLEEVARASECERRTVSRRLERAHGLIDEALAKEKV